MLAIGPTAVDEVYHGGSPPVLRTAPGAYLSHGCSALSNKRLEILKKKKKKTTV